MSIPDEAHADIKLFYEYWRSITPEGRLPGRQHFDPISIPQLLSNLWLIEVHREPLRFWRRLVVLPLVCDRCTAFRLKSPINLRRARRVIRPF